MRMALAAAFLAAACVIMACSSGTPDVAGGAGSGNPGAVALTIRADSTGALSKAAAADTARLKIVGDDSLGIAVAQAYVVVQRIRFILDTTQPCDEIARNVKAPMVYDSCSILLESTFICNILTGETDPPLEILSLPAALYTGIKLTIAPTAGAPADPAATDSFSLYLTGSFEYRDSIRDITFSLCGRTLLFYHHADQRFVISPSDTTRLLLALDPRQWLAGCRIKSCLDSGELPFDRAGNLTILDSTGTGTCGNLGRTVTSNIVTSGLLRDQR